MQRLLLVGIGVVLWPALALAQSGQVVEFYHTDVLGSVRVVTNQQGQVVSRHDYMPFGEEIAPQVPARDKRLFTGKERAFESGLDHFGARYYRADLGRFTTVDPALACDPEDDPQRWNAYAYASNNPLIKIDPDGLRWFAKKGNAVWVDPNKDGTYTSPGEGWVEVAPTSQYNGAMNLAFVDGKLTWIGEADNGARMQAPYTGREAPIEDTTFSFLAPFLATGGLAAQGAKVLAANRLPSVGFKLLNPTKIAAAGVELGGGKSLVRLAIIRQVILKQAPVGAVLKGTIVAEGRTLSFSAFRSATGEVIVTSIRVLK